jgi:hypothetical protein
MDKVADYMAANKLAINTDKTKLMILAQSPDIRKSCQIKNQDLKLVVYQDQNLKNLGMETSNNLKWNHFITGSKSSLLKGT